jgi:protein-S-isoprenylcysteine O-methyltransferase Ste14
MTPGDGPALAGAALTVLGSAIIALYTVLNGRARRRGARAHFVAGWILAAPGMFAILGGWGLLALAPPHLEIRALSIAGVLVLLVGAAVYVTSARVVGRWRTLDTYEAGLHVAGIYRRVRHPQALSLILVVIGGALASGSLPLLCTLPAWITFWIGYTYLEERHDLLPAFGDAYHGYMLDTPRLLPRISNAAGTEDLRLTRRRLGRGGDARHRMIGG